MSAKIVNRLLVITGTKKDGSPVWHKCGVVMEKNGKQFILLDRTFNPAGVPSDHQNPAVMITIASAVYEEKSESNNRAQTNHAHDYDDIPF